jgi:NAD-dependent deacetylase
MRAYAECENSDVLIVVGTSGLVQPAASLPFVGAQHGAKVVEVNPEATSVTDLADIFLKGPSGQVLPEVVAALEKIKQ